MPKKLKIEVVADVVCPWCYLGWARVKEALKLRPDVEAEVVWRSYQLRPETPVAGADYKAMMAAKFPDAARLNEMRANMKAIGKDLGLDMAFEKIEKAPNTNDAHRLIKWAEKEGKLDAVVKGVMRAYFTEGKFIGDQNVLADIGAAAGMDRDAIIHKFASGEGKEAVAADIAKNASEGISAVPYYVIGGTVHVEGSHPPEDLAQEIDKALQKAA